MTQRESQVSELARELDKTVEQFRNRPLDNGPYRYVWLDGLTQRCRAHFMRNLLARVPKAAQQLVATMVRSIFAQPDAEAVWTQHGRVVAQLEERFTDACALLAQAGEEILAFTGFPKEHWRQIWSNNPQERLNRMDFPRWAAPRVRQWAS